MAQPSPATNVSSQSTGISTSPTQISFVEPQASKIFRIVFFSLATLVSLVGNSIMLKAAREFPSRKPLSYHLVSNLAAAEIINTLCQPFGFVYMYLEYWPFGRFACTVTMPLQVVCLLVVTITLAAVAVYRFVLIVFQHRITVTYRKRILFLSLLWLTALAASLPLFVLHGLFPIGVSGLYNCFPLLKGGIDYSTYELIRFILNFGLPYLIMVVSYGAVAFKLKRHINSNKRETVEMSELGETTKKTQEDKEAEEPMAEPLGTEAIERERGNSFRKIIDLEKDLLKMIYVVIIVFAICYVPYQVNFLFYTFKGYERYPEAEQYRWIITEYCFLLGYLPSALHPLCYGTMSKFYARAFSRLVLCRNKSEDNIS